ncbi:hypothetical protein MAR_006292 [Mya arenaria]|uniref:Telomerase reverse transcriptase n=1 Tax=Mya arenaria TaxID=6604 RepID=A0ABY7D9Q8_MYAAR|nr:hypothetical protein MAR_006292 [Mya arenaria]
MGNKGGLTSEECQTERKNGLHRRTEALKVTSNVETRHHPSIEAFTMPSSVKTRQYRSTDVLKVPSIVETRQYSSIEVLKLPSNVEPRLPPCIESLEVPSHAEIPPKTSTKEKVKANSIPCIRTHLRRPTVILEKKSTLYARNARERILGSASLSTAMKSGQADGMVTEMLGVTEVDASTRQLIQAYFTDIAQNLKKCPLKALLNKHCPVGKVNSSTTNRKVLVWFPWCGLMFNVHTLEVSTDCSRYSGTRMTDSMSFDLTKQRDVFFAMIEIVHSTVCDVQPKVTVIKLQETIESDLPAVFHNVLV